jgi:catechol 2,3-dioxygenase-like lactoylglutathione lyase family enzyme
MPQPISLKTKIVTDRFEESRDWYVDLLGLVVAEQWDEPGDRGCILAIGYAPGEALLEIYHGAAAASYDGIGLQFRVPDIDAIEIPDEERFRVRGPINRPWGSRYLFLTDPNGISVVIFSGTSL